jgi:hypothetical protein
MTEKAKGKDLLNVTVYDGKYTVIQEARGGMRALRYGEEWRDLTGDGLVLALAQEVDALRERVRYLERQLQSAAAYKESKSR